MQSVPVSWAFGLKGLGIGKDELDTAGLDIQGGGSRGKWGLG